MAASGIPSLTGRLPQPSPETRPNISGRRRVFEPITRHTSRCVAPILTSYAPWDTFQLTTKVPSTSDQLAAHIVGYARIVYSTSSPDSKVYLALVDCSAERLAHPNSHNHPTSSACFDQEEAGVYAHLLRIIRRCEAMLYMHLFTKFVEFAQEMSAVIRDYYEGRTETVMIPRRNCAAIFAVADRTAFASIHFVRPSVAVRTCRFADGVRGKLRTRTERPN
jgi:hypothetical protein